MKKILSLLALVLMSCMGAWAQPNWSNQGALSISPAMKNGEFAAGTVFYTIQNKGVGSGCVRSNNLNNGVLYINSSASTEAPAQWAIIGDNTNGFMFVNRDTKTAIAMQPAWTNDNTSTNATNDANQYLGKLAATDADYTRFAVTPHVVATDANNGYFVIANKDVTHAYWNNRSNLLGYWYTSDDRGYKGWYLDNAGDNGASWKLTAVEALYADGVKFTLKNKAHNVYLGVNAAGTQLSSTTDCTEANTWTLKATTGGYKLYNESAGKYAGPIASRNGAIAATDEAGAGIYAFEFTNGFITLKNESSTTGYKYFHQVDWGGYAIVDWNANADASQWAFCALESDVTITTAQVTYNYKIGERIYKTVRNMQTVGNMATAPAAQDFVTFNETDYTLKEVTEEGITIDINCTEALPFAAAADFNSISTWYKVRLHSNQTHYQYYNEGAETSDINFTDNCPEFDNRYAWGFVGNLIDGFQMYNYVAGASKAVNTANPSVMAADNNTLILAKTTENVTGGFCLARSAGNYLNYNGGYIKNYGQADAGSTFRLTVVDVTAIPVSVTYTSTSGQIWTQNIAAHVGDVLDAAFVAVDFYTNFNITTANKTVSESNKTFNVTCEEAFPFTAGVATRIQSRGESHQDMDFYNGVTYPQYGATGFDPNTNLWVFEHVANSADLFTVKNVATGKYLTFQSGTRQDGVLVETPSNSGNHTSYLRVRKSTYNHGTSYVAFCLQHPTVVDCCYGPHLANLGGWPAGNETAALSNNQNCLIAIAPDACPVKLTNPNPTKESGLNGKYVGTFSAVYNVQLPDGVVAYKAAVEGTTVNFTEIGSYVPANTGVLLYAESAQANIDAQATPCANSAISSVNTEANAFHPTTGGEIPVGSYILANKSSHVSFYLIGDNRVVAKNKAYLTVPSGSNLSAFRFDFEDTLTGIEAIETENGNVIYDLQGRRVQNAKSGLYIVNGKKIIR